VRSQRGSSASGSLLELVMIVAVALGLAIGIQAFLVKPYRIPSASMVPTLDPGQRVLVNRLGMRFGEPEVGEVVVFHPPTGAEDGPTCGEPIPEGDLCNKETPEKADTNFIKRIVGGPGDRIRVEDGNVIRNGKRVDEPYTAPCGGGSSCSFQNEITVPADHWFMMGDNRGSSDDSRFWGPVPTEWIIGDAFATYWPPNKIGLL
jgi:signal peptidase I